jgi:glycosyltransferase involved in cell wall biosynthesis
MNEALLMNKPIIAPNFNPYKYYIEKYSIGILYNEDSLDDLANAIKIAKKIGPRIFYRNIKEYQKSLLYDNVKVFFSENIKNILEQ